MTWSAPMTAVSGNVLTASQFNTYVRNNLNETAPAKLTQKNRYVVPDGTNSLGVRHCVSAYDSNELAITSGSAYAWVDGGGPSVSCVTGTSALVFFAAHMSNTTADTVSGVGYSVTGATSVPLAFGSTKEDELTIKTDGIDAAAGSGNAVRNGVTRLHTGLNPGTNVFTMKYFQSTGGDCYYVLREIIVLPL